MKIGIKKIESISTLKIKNWGFLSRSSTAKLSPYINGTFSELIFTEGTASLEEEWIEDTAGVFSQVTASGTVRLSAKQMAPILVSAMMSKNIFRLTTMDNEKLFIGSLDFVPKLIYKRSISGVTTSEYQFTITCKSPHGLITEAAV